MTRDPKGKADERSSMWAGELDEADAEDDKDAENTEDAQDSKDAEDANQTKRTEDAWDVESIRDGWNPNSVRLPDSLQRRFTAYHSRVESELTMEGVDRPYGKDRHYKPLVIALGLRELEYMSTEDVVDALDTLERQGHLED